MVIEPLLEVLLKYNSVVHTDCSNSKWLTMVTHVFPFLLCYGQSGPDTYPNVQYDSSMTSSTVSQVTSNMKVDDNIDVARRTYTFSKLLFCIEVQ